MKERDREIFKFWFKSGQNGIESLYFFLVKFDDINLMIQILDDSRKLVTFSFIAWQVELNLNNTAQR